ncbi:hypothetical protein HNR42_001724 [Deinobacterium chartae]|uniref:Uncharacterized protein n=1 Tax=Deinobacterium chartae TaxID=521158 RepID=A0A841I1M7_9DEIO|nr:hypothetical protein [Deinobacterium chartae]MBB6098299.1 hypothetical protein [Deinobacterium chartae]
MKTPLAAARPAGALALSAPARNGFIHLSDHGQAGQAHGFAAALRGAHPNALSGSGGLDSLRPLLEGDTHLGPGCDDALLPHASLGLRFRL